MNQRAPRGSRIPPFARDFGEATATFTRIGGGELGGKAEGLIFIRDALTAGLDAERFDRIQVSIPSLTVLATDVFDAFMQRNDLYEIALSDRPDERIAHAFQKASLPTAVLGDLKALVDVVHTPLAIRSSSLLEDALYRPFAGVYGTKMIPNNEPDPDIRFRKLAEAIKFVYASTFFRAAKAYLRVTDKTSQDEKMAVVIQEVVGRRFNDRFYPHLSGVCRSYNYYPSGKARPKDGVVSLALGLGKTIVDGGVCWTYAPNLPGAQPPFASVQDMLKSTQVRFWAVNMGRPPDYDPINEAEYLLCPDLGEADLDGSLRLLASTYRPESDRLTPGCGVDGPRVINFAPLLQLHELPLNELLRALLALCEEALGNPVEIEFAMTMPGGPSEPGRLGFLQVRPMVVSDEVVEIDDRELADPELLVATEKAMGNGVVDSILDVVYVKPDTFEAKNTRAIAQEIERHNARLLDEGRPYLLIGFGRWGSSDPWLGIPVEWGQISGAKAIVEATLPQMNIEPSQGSHFFHNISSFHVSYFSVHHDRVPGIDWDWLGRQQATAETGDVRHVRLASPLLVKVDGRTGRGLVRREHAGPSSGEEPQDEVTG